MTFNRGHEAIVQLEAAQLHTAAERDFIARRSTSSSSAWLRRRRRWFVAPPLQPRQAIDAREESEAAAVLRLRPTVDDAAADDYDEADYDVVYYDGA